MMTPVVDVEKSAEGEMITPAAPGFLRRLFTPGYWSLKFQAMMLRTTLDVAALTRWHVDGIEQEWRPAYDLASYEYVIPSTHSGREIKLRVYSPPKASEKLGPVHLNYHSSGYVLYNLGQDSDFCLRLAAKLNITVIDGDYSKGPELPFPAAYDDVSDAVAHILTQGDKYDLSNFTMGGFSVGGTIALQTPMALGLAKNKIKASLAMYPAIDLSVIAPAPAPAREGATGVILTPDVLELFWDSYLWTGANRKDPRVSPQYGDISLLPKHVAIITAGADSLRFEGERFAEKLKAAGGRDIWQKEIPDATHLWDKTAAPGTWEYPLKQEMYEYAFDFLAKAYAS